MNEQGQVMSFKCTYFAIVVLLTIQQAKLQTTDKEWFDRFLRTGEACKSNTCQLGDSTCECFLTIDHALTMRYRGEGQPAVLLRPDKGKAVRVKNGEPFERSLEDTFILADGYKSRIVIVVNGKFPGPTITAREGQEVIVHVRNLMHTDSTTIHWHGLHQKKTPWSDGVAFVTQCPILPGQNYTYKFNAKPFGTSFYHAHIGDQRTMGLYGPLVIIPTPGQKISSQQEKDEFFVAIIQDWNHDDDEDALYQKMIWGVFDSSGKYVNETKDPSGARYSRFKCHSGLINGRGRFYRSSTEHNEVPLTRFEVEQNKDYRFRVISAATLYPFRVFVERHRPIYIVASDGFEIGKTEVESFIIHPGERIDFLLNADEPPGTYLLVAETLEVYSENEYHAAEAIIHYQNAEINLNPPKAVRHTCDSSGTTCRVFNCPFTQFSSTQQIKCVTFNDVSSIDPNSNTDEVKSDKVVELFFNFAFPGENGYTPGSVNGHQFLPPTVAAYAQPELVDYDCNACNASTICECTYAVTIDIENKDLVYQFVMTNIGGGAGWSHPVHLHGHSFYVMKMVFATYDNDGQLMQNGTQDNIDIICPDSKNFCSDAKWRNENWTEGRHPDLNWNNPPQKDTIIIPSGGYVIIRFKADNPGVWFFHCHIDLHNTNGMGMIIRESPNNQPPVPDKFPKCGSFLNDGKIREDDGGDDDGGASCFSATSTVFTESRGYITLNNLTIGEKVLSMNKNNELHFSEVIMFLHRDVHSQSVFLIVETESRHKLYISKKHLIYIADSPSYITLRPTLAESIRVGQYILGISSSKDASLKFSKVVRVDHVTRNGVFAPLTEDGKIIVDGVLASCYANIYSDDLAHFAFLPARSFYSLNKHLIYPMIGLNSTGFISEGIHWYADALLYLGKLLYGTQNLVLSI
ncbi:uncharacterized protein LOC134694824 isoform X2 [Mytilus trossulus]|uniref:uncharacterized protein LOC134694824 isoform X2 n=1 Tax=Mytilus trossulus TaxID=6551 RepID=UPI003004A969